MMTLVALRQFNSDNGSPGVGGGLWGVKAKTTLPMHSSTSLLWQEALSLWIVQMLCIRHAADPR